MSILIAKKYVYAFCDGSRIIQRKGGRGGGGEGEGDFPWGQLSRYLLFMSLVIEKNRSSIT